MGRQVIRNKVCTKIYKSEKKLRKGIEKMAQHGWSVSKITAYDKGRNIFQARNQRQLSSWFGLGRRPGLFSKRANSFMVIYERS